MFKPFMHQREGSALIEGFDGRVLLADDPGLGKTATSLLWSRRNPDARPVVIVVPTSLRLNWVHEASLHFNIPLEVLETTKPPKRSGLKKSQFYVIGYNLLPYWWKWLRALKPQILIADEGHFLKNRNSKRRKAFKRVSRGVPHVIIMTGTPMTTSPVDLWSLLNILHPRKFKSFTAFAQEYSNPELTRYGWIYKGARNVKKLNKMLFRTCLIRRLKKDVLDLPPKRKIVVPLEISNRKEYELARNDYLKWARENLDKSKARRALRAAQVTKLTYMRGLIGKGKIKPVTEWVENFLEGTDGKLVLFGIHVEVVDKLFERFEHLAVKISGSVKKDDRFDLVRQFQTSKKKRLLVGNIATAGVGLNMFKANTVALMEFPWTPAEMLQAIDRVHRIGQVHDVVNVYFLVGYNTVDEKIAQVLQDRQDTINDILEGKNAGESLDIFSLLEDFLNKEARNGKKKGILT